MHILNIDILTIIGINYYYLIKTNYAYGTRGETEKQSYVAIRRGTC